MIVVLDIAYYGKHFSGFAKQPGQLTVQGNLEEAISKVFSSQIDTTCAGRTDSGVHAKHQFVSFDVDDSIIADRNEGQILSSLDKLTHDDIHINSVEFKQCEFSARFDARARKYSYFICNQKNPALFMRNFSWHVPQNLNLDNMKAAAKYLIGEHDFKSFCVAASAKDKPTMRNISNVEISNYEIIDDNIIEIKVEGNAFLHSMVRTIVGSLVRVGTGHREPQWMQSVIDAKDRQAAGECAPACGLVLMDVVY